MKSKKTMLWVMALCLCVGGLHAVEPDTPVRTTGDTVRMTWRVASGDEKSFTFTGTAEADFIVEWGDGSRNRLRGLGDAGTVTAKHTYRRGQTYNVKFYGLPEMEQAAWEGYTETAGGMAMDMVYVEGGSFRMGCTEEQYGVCNADESPVHTVTLDGYYIGRFEVTQGQWAAVMGKTWEHWMDSLCYGCGWASVVDDGHSVFRMTWYEAQAFCERLSEMTGKTYRLPTEAEWEYAARGGVKKDGTRYSGGDDTKGLGTSYRDGVENCKPNGLGIFDMSTGYGEYCYDGKRKYNSDAVINPQELSATDRANRGNSSYYGTSCGRVSERSISSPASRNVSIGFRVVCVP